MPHRTGALEKGTLREYALSARERLGKNRVFSQTDPYTYIGNPV